MRTGFSRSIHDVFSITVGTIIFERELARALAQVGKGGLGSGLDVGGLPLRRLVDRRLGKRAVEGLPDDHGQHRAVREGPILAFSGTTSSVPNSVATLFAAAAAPACALS